MDHLIESVGSFGKFQYRIIFIVGLVSMLSSALIYATIFIAAEPDLICQSLNSTYKEDKSEFLSYDTRCKIWDSIVTNNSSISHFNDIKKSDKYQCFFDKKYYTNTVINEWNLVCDRYHKAGIIQTSQILGSLFGCFGGFFGDIYGRRISVIIFAFLLAFTLFSSQFLMLGVLHLDIDVKYWTYVVSQFFIGLLVNCVYCTAYVILMEITTEKYRTRIANINSYIYAIGELIVFLVYYFSRDWHFLNWFLVAYSLVLCFLLILLMPESPVWLISCNHNEEGYRILRKIARVNGIKNYISPTPTDASIEEKLLDENKYSQSTNATTNSEDTTKSSEASSSSSSSSASSSHSEDFDIRMAKYLVIPMSNLIKTSILLYIWAALMLLYYGISLGVLTHDSVDPYLMYLLSVVAEVIGYTFCYLNDFFGPKKMMTGFFIVTTCCYSFIALLTLEEADPNESSFSLKALTIMFLGLTGKCMVSGIYNLTYIYTAELYTVNLRNTAIQILTSVGGVTSLISPQINLLKTLVWNPLPNLIYSIFAIVGAIVVWFLPDTRTII